MAQSEEMLTKAYRINPDIREAAQELGLKHLSAIDLREELVELKLHLGQLEGKSGLVFSHNDFLGSNILVTKKESEVILIDAEYSGYR